MGKCCANGQDCYNCTKKKHYLEEFKDEKSNLIKIAFVGIPNCGKTTAYNYITGSSASTGNRPGVTVDVKARYPRKCILKKALKHSRIKIKLENIIIVDIPGIYSLDSYTPEERVAEQYLTQDMPDVIINVIDATNMERGLFLTLQLLQMGIPVVIALNMMDEAKRRGYKIDIKAISENLGVRVLKTVAYKGHGLEKALGEAINLFKQKSPSEMCDKSDNEIKFNFRKNQEDNYKTISEIMAKGVKKGRRSRFSDVTDRFMLNGWFGIPFFIAVMIGIFWLTFGSPGTLIKDYFELFLNYGIDLLKDIIIGLNLDETLTRLINNGILDALAGVFAFIPQIIILFLFIALMEDIGLIGRAAFLTDAFMRRFGLSGRAFIPMILGFGCTVPAILSTRTIPDKRDRIVTALAVPFISCGARLPVYSLIAAAFFKERAFIVIAFLYILGFVASLVTSLIFKRSIMKGDTAPLIFELPPYRIPGFRNVRIRLVETAWDFVSRLTTLILLASIVIWIFQNFTLNLQITSDPEFSIMADLGRIFAPFFEPVGFGDWQRVSALLAGLAAKETIIAAFEIIYGGSNIALLAFNIPSALSFMVFVLLYVPCIASVSAMYKEFGKKRYVVISLIWQIFVSWISAFVVFNFAKIMGW